jgi:hypothetical protein
MVCPFAIGKAFGLAPATRSSRHLLVVYPLWPILNLPFAMDDL